MNRNNLDALANCKYLVRNSKVADIIGRLSEYGIKPEVVDPWADPEVAKKEYGVDLVKLEEVHDVDCVIVAVAHSEFKGIGLSGIKKLFKEKNSKTFYLMVILVYYHLKFL